MPTVTCAAQNCSAAGCLYTLRCTASGSGSGNVSYGWSGGDLPMSEGPTVLVEEPPPDKPPPPPLTCTARNPVSSRNATVTSPAALCAGNGHGKVPGWVVGMGCILLPVAPAFPPSVAKGKPQPRPPPAPLGRGTYLSPCSLPPPRHQRCQETQPTLPPLVSCRTARPCPASLLNVCVCPR